VFSFVNPNNAPIGLLCNSVITVRSGVKKNIFHYAIWSGVVNSTQEVTQMILGQRIKFFREQLGLTQVQLAENAEFQAKLLGGTN